MILADYQDIMKEKLARQDKLLAMGAERHASGHCFHYGKISTGCRRCFTGEDGSGIQIGNKCMCNCPYCYYDVLRAEEPMDQINTKLADWFYMMQNPNFIPTIFAFQSTGETLMYIDELEKFATITNGIADKHGTNHYNFLYTNGILANEEMLKRLQDMRINEIRFHVSASNFSKNVYKNMEKASDMGFIVTIEEPSWQLHREKLFEMLPILDSIGGKHLDMIEVQISEFNFPAISKYYSDNKYRYYKDYFYHLYDDGLVYDIMEEVINKKYGYSVIDCNSAVERCRQHRDQHIGFDWNSVNGMVRDYDFNHPNPLMAVK